MNVNQKAIIGVFVVLFFIYFTNSDKLSSSRLTNDEVNGIIRGVNESFVDAEKEILTEPPEPPEPVVPSGPDPDPKKCICQGTGKIVQGDGHVSDCPYHENEVTVIEDWSEPESVISSTKDNSKSYKSQRGILGGRLFEVK